MIITFIIIISCVLVFFIIIPAGMYNMLIRKRNEVRNVYGSLDAMLKKRFDLIPGLIAAVKKYMGHEKELLTSLTQIRTAALSRSLTPEKQAELDARIGKTLDTILVTVEQYPELKSSGNFLQLQAALNEVEEQISAARRAYNAVVTDYNNSVQMFPSNLIAGIIGLKVKKVFKAEKSERKNIDVKNLFDT
jgi:LemA protein